METEASQEDKEQQTETAAKNLQRRSGCHCGCRCRRFSWTFDFVLVLRNNLETVLASSHLCLLLVVGFMVRAGQLVRGSVGKLTLATMIVHRMNCRFVPQVFQLTRIVRVHRWLLTLHVLMSGFRDCHKGITEDGSRQTARADDVMSLVLVG